MPRVRRRVFAVALGLLLALVAAGARTAVFLRTARVETALPAASGYQCAAVRGDVWSPLPGLEYTGRLLVTLPGFSGGEMVIIAGDTLPLDVNVEAEDGSYVPARKKRLQSGPGGAGPPPDYWLEGGTPWDAPREVQQLTVPARTDGDRVISVRLGRRAPRVLARLEGYPSWTRARVCAASLGVADAFQNERDFIVLPHMSEHFGLGWSGVRKDPAVAEIRSMEKHGAILVGSARRGAVHLVLHAIPRSHVADDEEATLSLRVNDVLSLPGRRLRDGLSAYEWDIPAVAWLAGTNELLFSVSGQQYPLDLALSRLELKMSY